MKHLLTAALIAALPAHAFAFDDDDRAAVTQAIANYDQAFVQNDFDKIIGFMPDRIVGYMAQQMGGVADDKLRTGLAQQMRSVMASVSIDSFKMDAGKMITGQTDDGFDYAFIPTATKVTAQGQTRSMRTHTLAIEDAGEWFFVRIDQPEQYQVVQQVYPGFANISLP